MILCFELDENDVIVNEVLALLRKRLAAEWDALKFPYNHARLLSFGRLHALCFEPSYPKFYPFGLAWIVLCLFLGWHGWAFVPGVLISLQGVFWLPLPYYVALLRLLRKHSFKGRLRWLSCRVFVRRLVHGSD